VEPLEYLKVIGRRWLVILVLGLLTAGAAWAYASSLPSLYRSTSSVFVSSLRGETTSELVQGSTFTRDVVQSYAQLASMPVVLDPVIANLGLEASAQRLASSVTVNTPLNTVIIEITVTDGSAERAAAIADGITASLSAAVQSLAPRGPNNSASITLQTVSAAQIPSAPSYPNTPLIVISGFLAGITLGVLYALARETLDTRVRGEKDLLRVTDAPLLGKVGRKRRADGPGLVMLARPYGAIAENYRRIRANLEFIDVDHRPHTVVISSPLTHDGKSTTAVNLALAMAERSPRVLLIDADLRQPSIAEICDIPGEVGLTTILVGTVTAEEAITVWANGLHVLPSGAIPPNPGQLLGSATMSELLGSLRSKYDFIVMDSPPLLPATDALALAHIADGAIVVTRYKSTRRAQLAATVESLEAVNARVLGIVLNLVHERSPITYDSTQAYGVPAAAQDGPPSSTQHAPNVPLRKASAVVPFPSLRAHANGARDDQQGLGATAARTVNQDEII
jgi:capsular exopolysaccharide synthesis family protein